MFEAFNYVFLSSPFLLFPLSLIPLPLHFPNGRISHEISWLPILWSCFAGLAKGTICNNGCWMLRYDGVECKTLLGTELISIPLFLASYRMKLFTFLLKILEDSFFQHRCCGCWWIESAEESNCWCCGDCKSSWSCSSRSYLASQCHLGWWKVPSLTISWFYSHQTLRQKTQFATHKRQHLVVKCC